MTNKIGFGILAQAKWTSQLYSDQAMLLTVVNVRGIDLKHIIKKSSSNVRNVFEHVGVSRCYEAFNFFVLINIPRKAVAWYFVFISHSFNGLFWNNTFFTASSTLYFTGSTSIGFSDGFFHISSHK